MRLDIYYFDKAQRDISLAANGRRRYIRRYQISCGHLLPAIERSGKLKVKIPFSMLISAILIACFDTSMLSSHAARRAGIVL